MNTELDITAPSARADRDALADRTDVLDKVGVLRTLPDNLHVTTDMVAEFYRVPVKTVQTIALRSREELDDDGYQVVTRGAFLETFTVKVSNLAPKVRTIALFPRRAVLRVGMLLRDSDIARQVRGYLLDAEADNRVPLTDEQIVYRALQIQQAKIAELEPKAAKFDRFLSAEGDYAVNEAAKLLHRAGVGTGEHRLFEAMRMMRWIYRDHKGHWRAYQTALDTGYLREKPMGEWVDESTGRVVLKPPQVRVTPKGVDTLIGKLGNAA